MALDKQLNDELMSCIYNIKRFVRPPKIYRDLSYSEMSVFTCLKEYYNENENSQPVKTSLICERLKISKPALSQIINKLEDKGFVERVTLKEDRRSAYIKYTQKGLNAFQRDRKATLGVTSEIIERMGTSDIKELIRILNKLADTVSALDYKKIIENTQ